jgi:hypothetical protein
MTAYISGPITHATGPDQFGPLKHELEMLGYTVLNPKDVPACRNQTCLRLPHEIDKDWEHSWACYLKHDLAAMLQHCDTIVMMDGWQDSHGARLEMSTAAAVGMTILFASDILAEPLKCPRCLIVVDEYS